MKTLKVLNVRAGFATNSSSSHSVLLLGGRRPASVADVPADWHYGWDHFTLASEEMKRHYLASQLALSLGYDEYDDSYDNLEVVEVVEELLGPFGTPPMGVDHQSRWYFPYDWDGETPSWKFVDELAAFLARPDVVVLGGNDNGDDHQLAAMHPDKVWAGGLTGAAGAIARKDGDHWTLFNRHTGTKVRLAFDDVEPSFASAPELVDVKITDFCPFACAFCYQDSTLRGKHASLADVELVAERLARAQVFEVAIGGGEPTLHPNFKEIVTAFRSRGVVPNFTTRNLGWLRDEALVDHLKANAGSFAYSVQSAKEVHDFAAALEKAGWEGDPWGDGPKPPVVHVVMGTVPRGEFVDILKAVNEHPVGVTLLGYKRVGRADKPEHPYRSWWFKTAQEHGPYRLGVDTALAAESEAQLASSVSRKLFHTEDGRFSAYVDAVNMTMAPSSWEPHRPAWAFDDDWQEGWLRSAAAPAPKPRRKKPALAAVDSAVEVAEDVAAPEAGPALGV